MIVDSLLAALARSWRGAVGAGIVLSAILGVWAGLPVMTLVVALAAGFLAIGWPELARLPQPRVASVVIAVCAAAGIGLTGWVEQTKGIGVLGLVVAFGLIGACARELARIGRGSETIDSMAGTTAGVVLAVAACAWLGVVDQPGAWPASACAAVAAAASVVVIHATSAFMPTRPLLGGLIATVAGLLAGGGVGLASHAIAWWWGMLAGAAIGGLLSVLRGPLAERDDEPVTLDDLAGLALPLAVSGGPAWALLLISQ